MSEGDLSMDTVRGIKGQEFCSVRTTYVDRVTCTGKGDRPCPFSDPLNRRCTVVLPGSSCERTDQLD